MPRFTLFRRGRAERSLEIDKDLVLVGRLPGTDIELDSPTVSRHHARIRREGDSFVLEDVGSVNGVQVRGRRVLSHVLVAGDVVSIEDYALAFEPPAEVFAEGLRGIRERASPGNKFGMTFVSAAALHAAWPRGGGR